MLSKCKGTGIAPQAEDPYQKHNLRKSPQSTAAPESLDPTAHGRLLENRGGTLVDANEEARIYGGRIGHGLGVSVTDVNTDGCPDLYVANDFHGVVPARGRYDASFGTVVHGEGTGRWTARPPTATNLYLEGQVRALRSLRTADGKHLLVAARNDAPLQVLRVHAGASAPE